MAAIKNIDDLLKQMSPRLNEGEFVFVHSDNDALLKDPDLIGFFREKEGPTFIFPRNKAEKLGLDYDFIASWISLDVHSALDAVGLTAAFSTCLAEEGISCNVVAAFHHDHIFVDRKDAQRAVKLLHTFSNKSADQ